MEKDAFKNWIGQSRKAVDHLSDRLIAQFRATLAPFPAEAASLPGIHWCLSPDCYDPKDLGRDGHPEKGVVLPDLGLPRRMWAGGRVQYFKGGLTAGDTVTRSTLLKDIAQKSGRTGQLGIVALEHQYIVSGEVRVLETQNILYREEPDLKTLVVAPAQSENWDVIGVQEILTTPTLLFRYSAITFNGHRIHYDHPYATMTEGYPGLVVHGPLQATWMQTLATNIFGGLPSAFSYRGLTPLICGQTAVVEAEAASDGIKLRVRAAERNVTTMEGHAVR